MNVIYTQGNYRIVECPEYDYSLKDLKGDCFSREMNPDLSLAQLAKLEQDFEDKVDFEGVYGYELEKWNPAIGVGWEHVDSCWGFVGRHKDENHYIVDEFKRTIAEAQCPILGGKL